MPGSLWNDTWEGDNYARIYVENGWPDRFNRTAFMISRLAWERTEQERMQAEQPFEQTERWETALKDDRAEQEMIKKVMMGLASGSRLPEPWCIDKDRAACKVYYAEEMRKVTERIPFVQEKLAKARSSLTNADPEVGKAREDRIARYGW